MRPGEVVLQRVRVRCPEEIEPLHARLRLSYLLSTADFQPGRLPPSVILLLRRLRAPRPLTLSGVRVEAGWEQALRHEIDRQTQQAVRPVGGRIPAGAEAVLFLDMAELLACLGILTIHPEPDRIWVWQAAPGGRSAVPERESLIRRWREEPRFLPAALRHLEVWGEAVPVLQTFTDRQAEALCAEIIAEFGLALPPAARRYVAQQEPTEESREPNLVPAYEEEGAHSITERSKRGAAHLPDWLPERMAAWQSLPAAMQRLLTLAHIITRSASLAETTAAWQAIQAAQVVALESAATASPARRSASSYLRFERAPDLPQQTQIQGMEAEGVTLPDASRAIPSQSAEHISGATRDSGPNGPLAESLGGVSEEPVTGVESAESAEQKPAWDGLSGISTRFAGIFYLLNLVLKRDAPACFDAEFSLSDHLTAWGLIEGFGRMLLEEAGEETAGDPIWRLLEQLDGRRPAVPLASELPDRERTLALVYAHLREALEGLLGNASPRDLLCVRGTLYVTRIHVDLVMALDSIWLPARRTGLDASPAWCPELMRVILFHYV